MEPEKDDEISCECYCYYSVAQAACLISFLKMIRFMTVVMAVSMIVLFFSCNVFSLERSSKDAIIYRPVGENFTDFKKPTYIDTGNFTKLLSTDLDDNLKKIGSKWPVRMEIATTSFFRKISTDPNFDFPDNFLVIPWGLPPKTRLSPDMRRIARCVVASVNKTDHDINKCFVIDPYWPIWLIVLLGFFVLESIRMLFKTSILEERVADVVRKTNFSMVVTNFAMTPMIFLMNSYHSGCVDLGLSYTIYGQWDPKPYYNQNTLMFKLVFNWFMIFAVLNIIETAIYIVVNLCNCIRLYKAGKIKPINGSEDAKKIDKIKPINNGDEGAKKVGKIESV